jgi:hypothetical protein
MNATIKTKKLRLGLIYGMVAGLAFAVFACGVDAWLLERANVTFFWIKFIVSLILCIPSGALVGWLTIRIEKHGFAILLWGSLALFYSWLVEWIPITGYPFLINKIDPDLARMFDFSPLQNLNQFIVISMVVIGFFAIISGLLEINLIHQALLSPYISTSFLPILIFLVLFSLAGSATDQMINSNLREPVQAINNLIQFAVDNIGVDVPTLTARKMHLSAVSKLDGIIQKPRQLTLIRYDQNFGLMDILVDFEGTKVKCTTVFAQPTDCIILTSNP